MKLLSKVVMRGSLVNESPLLISTGEGQWIDKEILRGYDGVPYIPATALIGVLRHEYAQYFGDTTAEEEYFFGSPQSSQTDAMQSHFMLDDALPVNRHAAVRVSVRDGIKINSQTGIAEYGAKYDYEIVEAGNHFSLSGELTLYQDDNKAVAADMDKFVSQITAILKSGIHVGAKTRTGFGKLKCDNVVFYRFNFPQDGENWFRYLDNNVEGVSPYEPLPLTMPFINKVIMEADFYLKRSLIIAAYSEDPNLPDKTHIESQMRSVIPGTAIKGAFRHQTERIIRTLQQHGNEKTDSRHNVAEEFCQQLFGYVATNTQDPSQPKNSRFFVEESVLSGERRMIQSRIRIDRFTGGVINGALFDEQPIFHGDETIHLTCGIMCPQQREIGLLLLLLKDLWTGHLPLGGEIGVGRGLLTGQHAQITYFHDGVKETLNIDEYNDTLSFSNVELAQSFVTTFVNFIKGEQEMQ